MHTSNASSSPSAPNTLLLELLQRRSEVEGKKLKESRFAEVLNRSLATLTPAEQAELFVSASFLAATLQPLLDQQWLKSKNTDPSQASFMDFVQASLTGELSPLSFLKSILPTSTPTDLRLYQSMVHTLLGSILTGVGEMRDIGDYRSFTASAMAGMDRILRTQSKLQKDPAQPNDAPIDTRSAFVNSMYRAFDEMDQILGLNYEREAGMALNPHGTERLYEGAGVGVQTSYPTILLALEQLAPSPGSTFIDLGSGYGRVGLVLGLLRTDVQFIGYEYVGHRVQVAQAAADRSGLAEHVQFFEQDLSSPEFRIPEAEIYYMYDPFSQETYKYVFEQLKEIGRRRPITIVTKGRAAGWLSASLEGEGWWTEPSIDEGTLGLFHSQVRPGGRSSRST